MRVNKLFKVYSHFSSQSENSDFVTLKKYCKFEVKHSIGPHFLLHF